MQHMYFAGNAHPQCTVWRLGASASKAPCDEKFSRSSQELALHVFYEHCLAIWSPVESTKELVCIYIKKLSREGGSIFLSSRTCIDRSHGHQLRQISAWKQS